MSLEPLIPFITAPKFTLLPPGTLPWTNSEVAIQPFGTLVAVGVYLAAWLILRHARRIGVDENMMNSFIMWAVIGGFVGAHLVDTFMYKPDRFLRDPLVVFRIWDGMSSFGGFLGGVGGAIIWSYRHRQPLLPYADLVATALPVGWFFGRIGCAVAHDHPGIESTLPVAMVYPDGTPRLDLGFLEMVAWVPIVLMCLQFRKSAKPWGFYLGFTMMAYAPTRFALDFLRATTGFGLHIDRRYLGLTPAQWWAIPMLIGGVLLLRNALEKGGTLAGIEPPRPPEGLGSEDEDDEDDEEWDEDDDEDLEDEAPARA